MHRLLASSSALLAVYAIATFAGCSSSSGNGGTGTTDGGGSDVVVHKDGAASSSGGSSGSSSGSSGDDGGGDDGGGGTCPDNTAFTPVAYGTVTAHRGVCTAADIQAFVTACGDSGTNTTCGAWQDANAAADGGGTACGLCILDPTNKGATWVDQMGYFGPNYAGCIQLTDTTNGPACAAAFDAANDCVGFECDSCADQQSYDTCQTSVAGAICKQYVTDEQTKCAADLGDGGAAGKTCFPGGGGTLNPDFTYIATLICGSADGG